ncbi:hypothetical protein [Pseudoalteromonas xiamenensis]|uniref:Uncharacterized protein n=1 Tax=Pseudoalteromonas xiamenensis TaxID=882626 RepID=A0A975HLR0_9GAMM|nr:hypothetical protein [Pseudoalteromonas xiamenensis]QTH72353.1 hypothetical protein J5O05_05750 [Pseudoalteromonas xiamenensis]
MGDVVAQYEESFILDAALRKLTLRMNNVYRKKEPQDIEAERQSYYRACMSQFHTLGYLEELREFDRCIKSSCSPAEETTIEKDK